jgi:O-antigen/teichoic acid export membrane protein
MAVVTTVVLTRTLGPEGYGAYAYAVAWATILAVPAVFGFDRLVVRLIARYEALEQFSLMRGLLSFSSRFVLGSSVGVGTFAAVAGIVLLDDPLLAPFLLGTATVPVLAVLLIRQSLLQGLGRVELGLLPLFVAWPGILMVLTVVVALASPGRLDASLAVALNLTSLVAALGVASLLLRNHLAAAPRSAPPSRQVRGWLRAAAPLAAVAAVYLGGAHIGAILLGSLSGAEEVGLFQAPARLTELLALVLMAFNLQLQPIAARLHSLGNLAQLQAVAVRNARASFAFALPVGAAMIVFREPLLSLLGPGFASAGDVLVILVAGQLVLAGAASASVVLTMTGHAAASAVGIGAGLAANVVACAILIPPLGAEGAALARLLDLLVWNVVLTEVARRKLGIRVTVFGPRPPA